MSKTVMTHADYGKSDVRVVKVRRDTPRHELRDARVEILIEGDLDRGYLHGDNTDWMSTDTIRHRVYAVAKSDFDASLEDFGAALVRHFVAEAPQARRVTASLTERLWDRIHVDGEPHDHAFVRAAGLRTARVAGDGETFEVQAGIRELSVLKTTASGWVGYLKDPMTTLPETTDRILATDVTATWDYGGRTELDFDRLWADVREQVLTTFSDHYSPGVQNDIYLIGSAVLERIPEIERIHFSLPNNHHLLYDLERFGIDNELEVFHASGDPHGLIEGTVARADGSQGEH